MSYDYPAATVASVQQETDAALAAADELVAQTVASASAPSFEATMRPLDLAGAELVRGYGRGAFLTHVHVDPAVRDAGQVAEERIDKWRVAVESREDVYRAVRAFADTDEAAALTGERRRLLDFWLRDFRRAGHDLDPAARAELEELRGRLIEVSSAFQRNLNELRDGIEVTREQLDGLPGDYIERLSPGEGEGTYFVSLDYPELNPFLDRAHHRDLRRTLFGKHWSRCRDENRALLVEALGLRRRMAALLGQPTWAHHALEVRMAATPDRVRAMYEGLVPAVEEAVVRELDVLREMLTGDGHDGPIEPWDHRYYTERLRRERHGVDRDAVAAYFPLERVVEGMFAITGEVLGISYRQVPDARAWHESVRLYEISDTASGEHIASFYADLFPREGKYGHAAEFPLVLGHRRADGGYQRPVCAIVANFTPPSGERPALLRHDEVETLFHEFGHVLHECLTRAELTRFAGTETEGDFVEAPSQIMEHWTWDASVLRRFARHHETGELLPTDLVDRMVAARWLNVGLHNATQVFYGTLDQAFHSDPDPDLDGILRDAYRVTGMRYPDDTFMPSGFGHLLGGYDAGYYGYLWAEVIGDDMFGRFAREGVLSPTVGADYRREVLERGGSRSGDEMVRAFLGREASTDAFLRLRGMTGG